MQIKAIKINKMIPPQDDLLWKIKKTNLGLKEGDVVAISSKVVSIHEGRCVVGDNKRDFAIKDAEKYFQDRNGLFTIKHSVLIRSCGIDKSNGKGFMILWPEEPKKSAEEILKWLKKEYKIRKLGLIITDSHSIPLRRGSLGFALSYAGFSPLYDYRGKKDLFGREMVSSQSNIVDALATSAVLSMGEGAEQTPVAVIRDVSHIHFGKTKKTKKKHSSFEVPFEEDVFGVFLKKVKWRKN